MGLFSFLFGSRKKTLSFMTYELPFKKIKTKVVGVSFKNDNGTSRQKYISKSFVGEKIHIIHKPIKGHPNALAVYNSRHCQIGHLSSELASEVVKDMNKDYIVLGKITSITGGEKEKPTLGCNIELELYKIIDQ